MLKLGGSVRFLVVHRLWITFVIPVVLVICSFQVVQYSFYNDTGENIGVMAVHNGGMMIKFNGEAVVTFAVVSSVVYRGNTIYRVTGDDVYGVVVVFKNNTRDHVVFDFMINHQRYFRKVYIENKRR